MITALAILVILVLNVVIGAGAFAASPYYYDIVEWRFRTLGRIKMPGGWINFRRLALWYLLLAVWPVILYRAEKGKLRAKRFLPRK